MSVPFEIVTFIDSLSQVGSGLSVITYCNGFSIDSPLISGNTSIRRNMYTSYILGNAPTRRNMNNQMIPGNAPTRRNMTNPLIPGNAPTRRNMDTPIDT